MYRNVLLPQLKRAPWRTALFLVLLAIATAFFCLSANLYRNSNRNITAAADSFSTIGIFEFYEKRNKDGEKVDVGAEGYIGVFSVFEEDIDWDRLSKLPGVKKIDLRQALCAFIPDAFFYYGIDRTGNQERLGFTEDLLHFKICKDQPIVVEKAETIRIDIEVLGWANPLVAGYDEVVQLVISPKLYWNDVDPDKKELVLYPDTEYVAPVSSSFYKVSDGWRCKLAEVSADVMSSQRSYEYYVGSTGVSGFLYYENIAENQPFDIWNVHEVKKDPALRQYIERVSEAYQYSARSFLVMTTEDLEGIFPFHQGKCYITQGRSFSRTDYQTANRVCIISSALSKEQGWTVGDKIDLHFYDGEAKIANDREKVGNCLTLYKDYTTSFFDESEYTIVGIWDEVEGGLSSGLDTETEKLYYGTILVPTSSVQNLDTVEAPASGSRLTVHLENGMMDAFLEAASKVTLSESADEVRITAFDQGYSQAQDSLQSMLGTAQFLLVLSSVLLVVAGVLLAFFYTQSQKQNMALMRLLGCSRRQAGTMAMLGSLLILLPGGILGTAAGHLLTDRVANAILRGTSSLDKPEYAGFREIFGVQAEVDFALSAQPAVSAVTLAAAAGLFLLGCMIFTLLLLRKEPREMLAEK